MSTTKPLNTVLIGLGMVADTHLQAIANLQDIVHLKGVYTRNQDAAQAYTHKVEETCGYGCEVYPSIEAIAADTDLDFAIILTPPNARLAIVEAFTEAGLPMLMEKPIERSYAAAEVITPVSFDAPALVKGYMLLVPGRMGKDNGSLLKVGASCRICPVADCFARREASLLNEGG